jgi:hypothetical protein
MTYASLDSTFPVGHVIRVSGVIALLSIVLCAGLSFLGFIERINAYFLGFVADQGITHTIPSLAVWFVTIVQSFGIPWVLLTISSVWGRVLIWMTLVVITCGWVPVLALAAHAPDLAGPIVVSLWSGICSLVYSSTHPMPSEYHLKTVSDETR